MKQILKIAGLELKLMLYSPIAWLVFVFFIVQSGADFARRLNDITEAYANKVELSDITAGFFDFWRYVQYNLIFYIPLLTMSLFSREISSGSIKLLQSSPISSLQIVVGKYLSMLITGLAFIAVLFGFAVILDQSVLNLDRQLVASALIGTLLLICAYSAIGLFISSLTSYQVVAVIGSVVIFGLLDAMAGVWQDKDFFRDLTYFMALSIRPFMITQGLISTEDIAYFIIIILLFLGFVVIRMENKRTGVSFWKGMGKYWFLTGVLLLAGYASSWPTWIAYFDMTATRKFTLSEKTLAVLNRMPAPLQVNVYCNVLDHLGYSLGYPSAKKTNENLFYNYQQHLPLIKFNYFYYYDTCSNPRVFHPGNAGKSLKELTDQKLEVDGFRPDRLFSPEEMKQRVNLDREHRLVYQLQVGDKRAFVRIFDDQVGVPMEEEITNALRRITDSIQTIAFVRGHGEREIEKGGDTEGFKTGVKEVTYRNSLLNYGFDIIQVNLSKGTIPENVSILVIADPKFSFSKEEMDAIDTYIQKGGNVMLLGEPGGQQVLNPIAGKFGVSFLDGALVQESKNYGSEFIRPEFSASALEKYKNYRAAKKELLKPAMNGASGISYQKGAGYEADTILVTDPGTTRLSGEGTVQLMVPGQPIPVALSLSRKIKNKQQRILIFGDADFMNNDNMKAWYPVKPEKKLNANFDVHLESFYWLSGGMYPIREYAWRPLPKDKTVIISEDRAGLIRMYCLWVIPGLVLLAGSIILLRRNRK